MADTGETALTPPAAVSEHAGERSAAARQTCGACCWKILGAGALCIAVCLCWVPFVAVSGTANISVIVLQAFVHLLAYLAVIALACRPPAANARTRDMLYATIMGSLLLGQWCAIASWEEDDIGVYAMLLLLMRVIHGWVRYGCTFYASSLGFAAAINVAFSAASLAMAFVGPDILGNVQFSHAHLHALVALEFLLLPLLFSAYYVSAGIHADKLEKLKSDCKQSTMRDLMMSQLDAVVELDEHLRIQHPCCRVNAMLSGCDVQGPLQGLAFCDFLTWDADRTLLRAACAPPAVGSSPVQLVHATIGCEEAQHVKVRLYCAQTPDLGSGRRHFIGICQMQERYPRLQALRPAGAHGSPGPGDEEAQVETSRPADAVARVEGSGSLEDKSIDEPWLKFNALSEDLEVQGGTESWVAFCGPVAEGCGLAESLDAALLDGFQPWLLGHVQRATQGGWDPQNKTHVYCHIQGAIHDGRHFRATLVLTVPDPATSFDAAARTYVVRLSLTKIRMRRGQAKDQSHNSWKHVLAAAQTQRSPSGGLLSDEDEDQTPTTTSPLGTPRGRFAAL